MVGVAALWGSERCRRRVDLSRLERDAETKTRRNKSSRTPLVRLQCLLKERPAFSFLLKGPTMFRLILLIIPLALGACQDMFPEGTGNYQCGLVDGTYYDCVPWGG